MYICVLLPFKTNSLVFLLPLPLNYLHSSFYLFLLYFTEINWELQFQIRFYFKNQQCMPLLFRESLSDNWRPLDSHFLIDVLLKSLWVLAHHCSLICVSSFSRLLFHCFGACPQVIFSEGLQECVLDIVTWQSSIHAPFFLSKKTCLVQVFIPLLLRAHDSG